MSRLKPLMEKNFLEYASYVIIDRAIPEINDGCKPVQRRILNTLFEINDGKFHKVANVIGETMKLHPHGDASIFDALVVLSNKEYFIEKQGNFGNIITGHDAAAARYIECRLTKLALDTLFNKALTEFIPSYDGRKEEPLALPAKLPVLLMLGTEGIAVGMSTKILPHNFIELLKAQINILRKKPVEVYPDFWQGGLIDVSEYRDGKGKVRVRARIDVPNEKKLVIREIPYGTTTSSLISSIESAAQKGKVSVGTINDYTTDKVEIELKLPRGITSDTVLPQLYAYTDCEVSISSNIVVIKDNHPAEITVTKYLSHCTNRLKKQIKAELELELEKLKDRQHFLTLEQIFIENRVYKRIEKSKTEKQIKKEVYTGMEPFKKSFIREMTDEDVKKLLEIRIRRISAYDREKYKGEIDDIAVSIEQCESKLKSLTRTVISFLKDLIDKYEPLYPRKTEISTFETIDKKSVARANIRMGYDAESRYFGSMVRSRDIQIEASEYDRILIVTNDGTFRIIGPVEKLFLPGDILYCRIFNPKRGARFTLAYRDNQDIAWGKRVVIEKFIKDKMYSLFPESKRGIIYFTEKRHADLIQLNFIRSKRQKLKKAEYDLDTLGKSSFASRGTRLHAKPVESIEVLKREKQKQSPAKKPSKSSLLTKAKGIKSITRPKKKKKST